MLKHLYTCNLLSTGEYWCYECEKPEKFTDGKCKRCLGHPGKRRKILKIAKNFFSTIGHKSRKEGAADLDLVATTDLPPPSYGSLHVRPQQIELSCATEIVEIDSVEISATRAPQNASSLLDPAAALDCMISSIPSPLSDWDFNLLTGAPGTATVENDHSKMSDRPALQLTTYDLAHYRRSRLDLQNKGKKLSPSSSLRSNANDTKGKTCGLPIVTLHGADDLLEIARFFLDELEHAAIPVSGPHPIAAAKSDSWVQQTRDAYVGKVSDRGFSVTVGLVVNMLQGQFANAFGLVKKLAKFQKRVDAGEIQNPRRAELELIQAGKGHFSTNVYFDSYVPAVRQHCDNIYEYATPDTTSRAIYHLCGIRIMKDVMSDLHQSVTSLDVNGTDKETLDDIFKTLTTGFEDDHLDDMLILDGSDGVVAAPDTKISLGDNMSEGLMATYFGGYNSLCPPATSSSGDTQQNVLGTQRLGSTQQDLSNEAGNKVESPDCCNICGFRPKGHPKWFKGTLTKHKKLQHKTTPPTIYRCPFPGCTSQYKNRPDNLRQHQLDKSHFVDGEGVRRPSKRKKVDDSE
ncbi:hypothetical protein HYQ44_019287 [Verticillium longisporum]|nr:hypothetical protein HYQ44_019287 [Verticillium longisporum]